MTKPAFTPAAMPDPESRERAVQRLAEASHRLNEAVRRAIEAGYSVELVRSSRHHDGAGNWGDQIVPSVRGAEAAA
ncbi:MAG: hypothetical protein ACK4RV_12945 [Caulobacter sp.]|jgi:hypothetical protein